MVGNSFALFDELRGQNSLADLYVWRELKFLAPVHELATESKAAQPARDVIEKAARFTRESESFETSGGEQHPKGAPHHSRLASRFLKTQCLQGPLEL